MPTLLPAGRPFALAAVIALAGLVGVGCSASAEDVFHRGHELEAAGRLEDAFEHYARALERDPDLVGGPERVRGVGTRVLAAHLAAAEAAVRAPDRADALLDADAALTRAARVGVDLDAPPSLAADRDAALAEAGRWLADAAERAVDEGRWSDALAARERAARYGPSGEVNGRLTVAARAAYHGRAEDELAAGRYRAAYASAAEALALTDNLHDAHPALVELRAMIEEAGAVRAAPLPVVAADDSLTATLPRGFEGDVDDWLADEAWGDPPLFVRTADPAEVRRALRRPRRPLDYANDVDDAAEAARLLDADFAVVVELRQYRRAAEVTRRDSVTARRRGGGSARYLRLRERVTLRARANVEAVGARARSATCSDRATAESTATLSRAEYDGALRELELSRDERELFDSEAQAEAERRLQTELAERLAADIARQAYTCLERQVR